MRGAQASERQEAGVDPAACSLGGLWAEAEQCPPAPRNVLEPWDAGQAAGGGGGGWGLPTHRPTSPPTGPIWVRGAQQEVSGASGPSDKQVGNRRTHGRGCCGWRVCPGQQHPVPCARSASTATGLLSPRPEVHLHRCS